MSGQRKHPKRPKRPRRQARATAPVMDDLPELREARALWARQDLFGALAKFDRAARQHPQHVRALVDASRAFGTMYNYARAEELLERLVELARGDGQILHLAAQSYRLLRRTEQAMACFQQALAGRHATSDSHLELALLYERRNQLDEALAHADARLRDQPHDAEGTFVKARVLRRQGNLSAASQLLREIVASSSTFWMTRGRAYAEWATLLDQQQDYAAAWQTMLAGKRVLAPHAQEPRAHRQRLVPPLMRLAGELRPEHIARWHEAAEASPIEPRLALLTGLPRSGTTLLQRILDAHPGIVAADEYDAFPRFVFPLLLGKTAPGDLSVALLDSLSERFLAPQRTFYAQAICAALGRSLNEAWLVDKNPSLLPLLTPYLRFAPRARAIVLLRDPRDVLVSCLLAYLPLNDFGVDFLSPDSAAQRLAADLKSWCELREKTGQACIEVHYEQLVADMPGTTRQVLQHLGLTWHDNLDRYREVTAARTVYSPSYDAVAQPIHAGAIGRWKHYETQLAPVLGLLASLAPS